MHTLASILDKHGCNLGIEWCKDYAEPGYTTQTDKGILFANWNPRTFDNPTKADQTMPRIAAVAEYQGYELEWSDEWTTCCDCHRAVRTSADSYSWKPSHWWPEDGGLYCKECTLDNPESYLEYLSGNPHACDTLDLDLTSHGYHQHNGQFESGWYPGQNDDPQEIAKQLEHEGYKNFVFQIDRNGQFDTHWSVWVK